MNKRRETSTGCQERVRFCRRGRGTMREGRGDEGCEGKGKGEVNGVLSDGDSR